MDLAATYDSIVYGGATPSPTPIVGAATSGGLFDNLGGIISGLSNTGLQWFQAINNGVQGKLAVPAPTQATPAQALASALPFGMSLTTIIILAALGVLAIFAFRRKG